MNSGQKLKLSAVAFLAAALTGCATALTGCATAPVTAERPLSDRIPPSLLSCASRPVAGDLTRQSDVARYVVDLDQAGEDCRRKVAGVRAIVQAQGERR